MLLHPLLRVSMWESRSTQRDCYLVKSRPMQWQENHRFWQARQSWLANG
jgi:hypothetical protein